MVEVERADVHREPLVFHLCPLHLILSLGTAWTELGSIFVPSFPIFWELVRFPFSFPSPWPVPALEGILQTLIPLCGPFLDSLHCVHVSLALRSSELGTALQVWLGRAEQG